MNDLTHHERMFVKAIADAARGDVKPRRHDQAPVYAAAQPQYITPQQQAAFMAYQPSFHTQYGLLTAKFRCTKPSTVTGEPVAYYDIAHYDLAKRCMVTKTALYGIRGGVISLVKQYEWRDVR